MRDIPLVGPMERALHLRSLAMLEGLRSRELGVLAQLMKEEAAPPGAVLCQEAGPPGKLRLLVEGQVRNERHGEVLGVQRAPGLIGLSGILGGRAASVRSVAETPATLLSIDAQDFLDVLEDQFAVFLQLRKAYASNVVRLQRRLGVFHTTGPTNALVLPPHDRPLGIVEQLLFLRRTRAFRGLPINLLAHLIRDERELRIPAGETLWHDGDPGTLLVVIVHGKVRCSSQATQEEEGGEGGPAAEFIAGAGYVLGADAAFGGIPYAYDAEAESDVVAVSVSATALTDMIEDHFELGRRSLAHFAQEDVRLQERKAGVGDAHRAGM